MKRLHTLHLVLVFSASLLGGVACGQAGDVPGPVGGVPAALPQIHLPDAQDLRLAVPRPVRAAQALVGMGRQRLALVLGLGTVGNRLVVDSAPRDAQAVAGALRSGGFIVMLREDVSAAELRGSLKEFRERLQPGGLGFVYITGLGTQVDGRNLLLPRETALDAALAPAALAQHLRASAVPLDEVADALLGTNDSPRMLVVDAAYRHPALAKLPQSGLTEQKLPPGVMALFGHALGTVQEVPAVAPLPIPAPTDPAALAATPFVRVLVAALQKARVSGPEALRATRRNITDTTLGQSSPWIGGDTDGSDEFAEATLLDGLVPRTPEELAREALRHAGRLITRPAAARAGEQSVADVLASSAATPPAGSVTPDTPTTRTPPPETARPLPETPGASSLASSIGNAASVVGTVASVATTVAAVTAAARAAEATALASVASTAVTSAASTALGSGASLLGNAVGLAARAGSSEAPAREAVRQAATTVAATAPVPAPVPAPVTAAITAAVPAAAPAAAAAAGPALAPSLTPALTTAGITAATTAPPGAAAALAAANSAALAATAPAAGAAGPSAAPAAATPPAPVAAPAETLAEAPTAAPSDSARRLAQSAASAAADQAQSPAAQQAQSARDPRAPDGRTQRNADGGERPVYTPRTNNFGYAEGDTFTYQVIDKWKGEVLGEYTTAIEEVLGNGHLLANGHLVKMDPQGRLTRLVNSDGSVSEFLPSQDLWWANPQRGESRAVKFMEKLQRGNRTSSQTEWKGSASIGRLRKIDTPAGAFDVLPIESSGWWYETLANGTRNSGQWTRTVYYAPKLGHPVAIDVQDADRLGKLLKRERVELMHAQQARGAP